MRLFFIALLIGFTAHARAQSDCRYDMKSSTHWTPPAKAEWSLASGGERSGIVNIYAHGSLNDLEVALEKAGYSKAKDATAGEKVKFVAAVLGKILVRLNTDLKPGVFDDPSAYDCGARSFADPNLTLNEIIQEMPVSPETLCGQNQVVAYEKDNRVLRESRHHLRVFNTGQIDENGKPVWAIAAIADSGLTTNRKQPKTFFLYHKVNPDTDQERDFVMKDLKQAEEVGIGRKLPLSFDGTLPPDKAFSRDQQAIDFSLR